MLSWDDAIVKIISKDHKWILYFSQNFWFLHILFCNSYFFIIKVNFFLNRTIVFHLKSREPKAALEKDSSDTNTIII